MRIIAGSAKGREILRPKTRATRPMADKVRAAIFNILGPIDGLKIADLYAGTGALGLEALSRGAGNVTGVELGIVPAQTIETNVANLGFNNRYSLVVKGVENWLSESQEPFDIIFAHPPYKDFDFSVLDKVAERLTPKGLFIIELAKHQPPDDIAGLKLVSQRHYGQSAVSFYQKKG